MLQTVVRLSAIPDGQSPGGFLALISVEAGSLPGPQCEWKEWINCEKI
jgi:hypothetical protein